MAMDLYVSSRRDMKYVPNRLGRGKASGYVSVREYGTLPWQEAASQSVNLSGWTDGCIVRVCLAGDNIVQVRDETTSRFQGRIRRRHRYLELGGVSAAIVRCASPSREPTHLDHFRELNRLFRGAL